MTASDVARYMLAFSRDHGDPISNLKLQKLLYYAQGWHLAFTDEPLFRERIEAWVHGPVVPPVYGEYKKWTWQPIMADISEPKITRSVKTHLTNVLEVYGSLTPIHLERLTHAEAPWIEARHGLAPDLPCTSVITVDSMRRFFKSELKRAKSEARAKA